MMIRQATLCFALLGSVAATRCWSGDRIAKLRPDPPKVVASDELEEAFRQGVQFLVDTQRKDGAWGGPQWTGGVDRDPVPGAFRSFDIAVTAMCLESLLAAEETESVLAAKAKALKFLLERTDKIRRPGPNDLPNVWAHCYCIQTFSKLIASGGEKKRVAELRDAIGHHMEGLKRWRSVHGGWFYYGSGMSQPINPSCSFVNAAVLVSLDRARRIGAHADEEMVRRAIDATKLMRKPDSSFIYTIRVSSEKYGAMRLINRPCGSLGRSQAGNLALR